MWPSKVRVSSVTAVSLIWLGFPVQVLSGPSMLQRQTSDVTNTSQLFDRDQNSCHAAELVERASTPSFIQDIEEQKIPLDGLPINDGPRRRGSAGSAGSAGLGIELETLGFQIMPVGQCSHEGLRAAKGQVINGVRGQKWKLTADIMWDTLDLEYIIDGTAVKIGTMEAQAVAGEIESHHINWNANVGDEITVEGSPCKWHISSSQVNEMSSMGFTPQITAPLPLSVIYDILLRAELGPPNPRFLDHYRRKGQERVIVTKQFFQSRPFDLDPETIHADVLGFFSVLLSWAKGAMNAKSGMLFKGLSWIMPRTNFVGLYSQVDKRLPQGKLFELIKVLACYRNDYSGPNSTQNNIVLDDRYCTGSLENPIPLGTMDMLKFKVFRNGEEVDSLHVSDWILGIQNKQSPDHLSVLGEKYFSASIGGKKLDLETIYGGSEQVPLWEFRDLKAIMPREFRSFAAEAEQGIMEYSKKHLDTAKQYSERHCSGCYSSQNNGLCPWVLETPMLVSNLSILHQCFGLSQIQ